MAAGGARQVGLIDDTPAGIAAAIGFVGPILLGAIAGAAWRTLDDRDTALLLDRALDTDELLVTATWLRSRPPEPSRNRVLDELAETPFPSMKDALPVRAPRHSRWVPLPLIVALIALLAPAWQPALALRAAASDDPVVQEGARLAERLATQKATEGIELPEGIESEVADLARDMQGELLTPEEALARLDEMQQQLDDFESAMAEQKKVLEDLEKAAEALDQQASTQPLADALRDLDMGAAGDAASKLADELGMQSAAQRQQTAQAMDQAGKALSNSSDPSVQQAGEAMRDAAQQMSANPQQGQAQQGEGQNGQGGQSGQDSQGGESGQGQQSGGQQGQGSGGLSPEQAKQLSEALSQARQTGEQLQKDREAMQRSQELNGALEGSRQRLGGEPSTDDGQSGEESGDGEGNQSGTGQGNRDGEGDGQGGEGQGEGMGMAGSGVGSGHTWEDQGEFTDASNGSDLNGQRTGDRDEGQVIDDFERLYKSVRDEDAQHLVTSVEGELDETGHIDQLPIRLTESDETASASTVQLPANYREAAAEAVTSEQVPPGYREAVKQYFDEME